MTRVEVAERGKTAQAGFEDYRAAVKGICAQHRRLSLENAQMRDALTRARNALREARGNRCLLTSFFDEEINDISVVLGGTTPSRTTRPPRSCPRPWARR